MKKNIMKKTILLCMSCLLFAGCSKTPELLEPVGAIPNSAIVEKGEIYNIEYYNSSVIQEIEEIKSSSDCIVKTLNVTLGAHVNEGDVLVTLDGGAMSAVSSSLDEQIAQFNKESSFANSLLEAEIKVLEAQLNKAKNTGDSAEVEKLTDDLADAQNDLAINKVEQAQQLANMEAKRLSGGVSDSEIKAPCSGTIAYLNTGSIGSTIEANTMIIGIAKDNSYQLKGDLIAEELQIASHELYALINGNKYDLTYAPYSAAEASFLVSNNYPLHSFFYFNADENIQAGMYAAVVRVWDYKADVLTIPDNALYTDENGYYVYVIKEEEKERRDITVGIISDVAAEVLDGLEEGEEVYVK